MTSWLNVCSATAPCSIVDLMSVGVSVRDLRLTIGDREILQGVDLEVGPSAVVAVIGVSGSGKTSLLKCMGGLQTPTSGSIRIGDVEISGLSESELNRERRHFGMVFQYAALFDSLTVYQNV